MKSRLYLPEELVMNSQQYISSKKAADICKIRVNTLSGLVKKGFFHRTKIGNKYYYKYDDILAYKNRKKLPKIEVSIEGMTMLRGKVSRIEDRIELIERILDLYYEPLKLTNLELYSLYKVAKEKDIDDGGPTIKYWGELLIRLNEQHFLQLAAFTQDYDCWKPFLELAYVVYGLSKVRSFYVLRRLLSKAYRNIRNSSIIYMELQGNPHLKGELVNEKQLRQVIVKLKSKRSLKKILSKNKAITEEIDGSKELL